MACYIGLLLIDSVTVTPTKYTCVSRTVRMMSSLVCWRHEVHLVKLVQQINSVTWLWRRLLNQDWFLLSPVWIIIGITRDIWPILLQCSRKSDHSGCHLQCCQGFKDLWSEDKDLQIDLRRQGLSSRTVNKTGLQLKWLTYQK